MDKTTTKLLELIGSHGYACIIGEDTEPRVWNAASKLVATGLFTMRPYTTGGVSYYRLVIADKPRSIIVG